MYWKPTWGSRARGVQHPWVQKHQLVLSERVGNYLGLPPGLPGWGDAKFSFFQLKKKSLSGARRAPEKRHLFATIQRPSHSLLASCTCVGNTAWAMAAEDIASKQCSAQSCALDVGCMPITHCTTGRLIHIQAHRRPCTWSMLRPARFRCDCLQEGTTAMLGMDKLSMWSC